MRLPKDHLITVAHSKAFHASHGYAHIAYFVAVVAEGHGFYSVIGGVMVVFSFIATLADEVMD